ncbi:YbaB/EbfC family nucleoid-associated protein [Actinoallomurus sp. NPDC050550]|uniref:YbaB/EbfC family nucleoid-associated protein n=1 Tax=Actinoallomurus sp. NPDC050550 TaxID=3154937 RepID=UPI00340C4685
MELPDVGKVFGLDIAGLADQAQDQASKAAELQRRISGLVGHAETADGRIRLSFSPDEGLSELRIDPRAMRLGSEELAETIRELTRQAMRDLAGRKQEAARELFGIDFEPEAAKPDPEAMRRALHGVSAVVESTGQEMLTLVERLRRGVER